MLARTPRPPLRILHCLRAPVGGLFRHVRDLVEAQAGLGHAVGVVCDSASADRLTEQRLADLAHHAALGIHRVRMSRDIGLADITAARQTRALAEHLGAEIIHGHGAKGGAYARLAAAAQKRAGRPVAAVYTPHGGSLHYAPGSLKGRLYASLERRLASLTDAIVFESAYSGRTFAGRIGAAIPISRVIHNGLRPEELLPHAPAPDAADILFVGELRALKGVDLLLAAIATLRTEHPLNAVIVGDGPDAALFRSQSAALGLDGSVRFAGAMPLRDALPLGRMMVVPSRAESLPYIVLEAAAAAMPLLATDVGGIGEIVAGTDTRLVAPESVPALARAIRDVLADDPGAKARALRLQASVADRFSVARMTAAILDVYADAAAALTAR